MHGAIAPTANQLHNVGCPPQLQQAARASENHGYGKGRGRAGAGHMPLKPARTQKHRPRRATLERSAGPYRIRTTPHARTLPTAPPLYGWTDCDWRARWRAREGGLRSVSPLLERSLCSRSCVPLYCSSRPVPVARRAYMRWHPYAWHGHGHRHGWWRDRTGRGARACGESLTASSINKYGGSVGLVASPAVDSSPRQREAGRRLPTAR